MLEVVDQYPFYLHRLRAMPTQKQTALAESVHFLLLHSLEICSICPLNQFF